MKMMILVTPLHLTNQQQPQHHQQQHQQQHQQN